MLLYQGFLQQLHLSSRFSETVDGTGAVELGVEEGGTEKRGGEALFGM